MKNKWYSPDSLILAVIYMLFIISFSVVITLNFRPLYYFDIGHLDIPAESGYPADEIRENYDALIDYNSMFNHSELKFPTLAMSDTGRIHFVEVKNIFVAVQYLCIAAFLAALVWTVIKAKKKDFSFLFGASLLSIVVPAVLGALIALNWDNFFVTFHHIFFNNDYWIFDAATDPVITILPDTFFMHCALMILGGVVLGSILCFAAEKILAKRSRRA
ncbi:TIGR01906 family membrane protein [Murimonas intestini]|uniref:TIGR01906 family membrane protein n=1 Tax=Murimonas intestini TaxID=1337051 RepID=UPI0011DD4F68|nr:TIGR01906 family membrane protein [Murimonas intestini]